MAEITYRHEVPFGHRLMNHAGKCRFPHGHNYLFEVAISGPVRDDGMVIDFSLLKKAVREFLEPFDHAFVLHKMDPFLTVLRSGQYEGGTPTKVVVLNKDPTAENLARLLCNGLPLHLPIQVTCYEQRDCWATEEWTDSPFDVCIVENW